MVTKANITCGSLFTCAGIQATIVDENAVCNTGGDRTVCDGEGTGFFVFSGGTLTCGTSDDVSTACFNGLEVRNADLVDCATANTCLWMARWAVWIADLVGSALEVVLPMVECQ